MYDTDAKGAAREYIRAVPARTTNHASLTSLRGKQMRAESLRRLYEIHAATLFDRSKGLPPEHPIDFSNIRDQGPLVLAKLERFIDEIIKPRNLKKSLDNSKGESPLPFPRFLASLYFPWIPNFIRIVSQLSDRYEFNEHIQAFKVCSAELGFPDSLSWEDMVRRHLSGESKRNPPQVCKELACRVQEKCLSLPVLTAISQRRHEANQRRNDYQKYIAACFEKHERLIFVQIDLFYSASELSDEAAAARANKDLNRLLNNRRHYKHLKGWVGYIASLALDEDKGVYWQLLVWFDGRAIDGANHAHLAEVLGQYWVKLSKGMGKFSSDNIPAKGRRSTRGYSVTGLVRKTDSQDQIAEAIFCLTMSSKLFRLNCARDMKAIRRGEYPKALREENK